MCVITASGDQGVRHMVLNGMLHTLLVKVPKQHQHHFSSIKHTFEFLGPR